MKKYEVIKQVGDGTYGTVWKATNRITNETVAIKKMKNKFRSWDECMQLREIKCLRSLKHPNIVTLKDVILENGNLFLVFEYMECNLYQVMTDKPKLLTEERIRKWSYQVLGALNYMHQHGIFHRDLKPENLLVSGDVIKIADFGLAREVNFLGPYTDYVATRWYRAPEILIQAHSYGCAVDIWAMGAIMAELYTLQPLFPGKSELDQIYKICSVLGAPTHYTWPEGIQLANNRTFQFPQFQGSGFLSLLPTASPSAVALISSMLSWDPNRRPAAVLLRQHAYFFAPFERQHVIDIDPPKQGEYVLYNKPAGYNPPRQEICNNRFVYQPLYSPCKWTMQELDLFPSTNHKSSPQPAEAFSYGFPDVMRAQAQAQLQVQPPPCVTRHVAGLGIGSKHICCPSEGYTASQQPPNVERKYVPPMFPQNVWAPPGFESTAPSVPHIALTL